MDKVNSVEWVPYIVGKTGTDHDENTSRLGTGEPNWVYKAKPETTYVRRVRIQPLGINGATVARLFINNGGNHQVAANNILFDEVDVPGYPQ